MNELMTIKGVRGRLNASGNPELNLEDVVRGWGFTRIAASGNEVVRWARVRGYLEGFGVVPTSGHGEDVEALGKEGLPEYIPENIVYKLGFKAKNEIAIRFQNLIADEILPTLRKTGSYSISPINNDTVRAATSYIKEVRYVMEKQGNTPQEIAAMLEMMAYSFKIPLPLNFVKIPEQISLFEKHYLASDSV